MGFELFDYIMIAVYLILLLVVAVFTRRIKTFRDFAVGNRKLPFSLLFASIAATYVGPGGSIGFTGKGFENGFLFFMLAMFFPVQSIVTGVFIAPRIQNMSNCSSVGDIFAEKYGKFAKISAGIISTGLCLGFAAIMAMVGGKMLSSFTGLPMLFSVIIISGITTIYVYTGGLRASVATDVFQFSIFAILVPVFFFLSLKHYPEGGAAIAGQAASLTRTGIEAFSGIQLVGLALTFYLGEMLIPPYVNRALSANTGGDSTKSFVMAGIFGFAWLAVIFALGVIGRGILSPETVPDDVFLTLGSQVLPQGLYGLLIIAILGIIMSSQDSVINAGATTAVRDVVYFFNLDQKKELMCGKILTVIIAVIAGILALYLPSIIDSVLITYTVWAPTVAIPLVVALFLKKRQPWAGILSITAGGAGALFWEFGLKEPLLGIPTVLAGLTFCLLGFFIGIFIHRRKEA